MGLLVYADCANCNFIKKFSFGGGMRDHMTRCDVPALNRSNGKFVVRNYFKKDKYRIQYDFYNSPTMHRSKHSSGDLVYGEIVLKQAQNFCPKCKRYALKFLECALFD